MRRSHFAAAHRRPRHCRASVATAVAASAAAAAVSAATAATAAARLGLAAASRARKTSSLACPREAREVLVRLARNSRRSTYSKRFETKDPTEKAPAPANPGKHAINKGEDMSSLFCTMAALTGLLKSVHAASYALACAAELTREIVEGIPEAI